MITLIGCTQTHIFSLFFRQHYQHSKHRTCACRAPISFNHDTSMTNRRQRKTVRACTKCATACHKSTQHKLDQLFSSCHEHTEHSVDSEPIHCCCTAIVMYQHRAAFYRSARKAQLGSSILSGIPSTCSDYWEVVDTDASVFSLSLQAGGRMPPYYKICPIVWLCCSSEETRLPLFCRAVAFFGSTYI